MRGWEGERGWEGAGGRTCERVGGGKREDR